MFDLHYKAGVIDVIKNETTVARIFEGNGYYLVKCLYDGYDFSTGNVESALDLILIRMENLK